MKEFRPHQLRLAEVRPREVRHDEVQPRPLPTQLSASRLLDLKEIFSTASYAGIGFVGRRD